MLNLPCQKFHVPENRVTNGLKCNDKEKCVTGLLNILPQHHQHGTSQLNGHVEENEHDGEEPATTPYGF